MEENAVNPTEVVFSSIFEKGDWGDGTTRPKSGDGSSVEYTENLRKHLPVIFKEFKIKTFLDAPCGDLTWMPLVLNSYPINYIGADIVKSMVESHQHSYTNETTRFMHLDITKDTLPSADLWMCRDCLFHLPNALIINVFENFLRSDINYMLITTHLADSVNHGQPWTGNTDLLNLDGSYRLLNLFSEPFNLPVPLYRVDDTYGPHPKRELCLWSKQQIMESFK
jgi:hypothetical protein